MSYFQRLRTPLIVVSPELFRPNEATQTQQSGVKAKGSPPDQVASTEPGECALLALRQAEGSKAKGRSQRTRRVERGRAKPARPRREPPRRPQPRKLAEGRGFNPAVAEVSRVEGKGALRSASRPTPSGRPDLGRHERKCGVCCHPDRDAIEEAFIHWHSPTRIAQDYEISDDSLYRHAYATGLDAVRSRNLRCALERILEKAQRVIPTADSIVRAARAYTRINHAGEWVEPIAASRN